MWRWTVSPEEAPDEPTYIELTFLNGDIVAIDGIQKTPSEILSTLNLVGGKKMV